MGADHQVGGVTLVGRTGQDRLHHLARIAGAGGDLQAFAPQPGHDLSGAGDQVRRFLGQADHRLLEFAHDPFDRRRIGRRAVRRPPGLIDAGLFEQGPHVIGLGPAHVPARLVLRHGRVQGGEGLHQGQNGRPAAEIDHSAGPVENDHVETVADGGHGHVS